MTTDKFEEKIRMRAAEQADNAIREFTSTVQAALGKLLVSNFSLNPISEDDKLCLVNLIEPKRVGADKSAPRVWPAPIWRRREDAIRNEIFEKMDVVQRTLQSKPIVNPENVPSDGA